MPDHPSSALHRTRPAQAALTLLLGLLALLVTPAPASASPAATALSPIQAKYAASGGAGGPLGAPTTAETCGLVRSGCYQHFAGGSIYWSPTTPASIVTGPVRDRWAATGWEHGLGYPTRDTFCGLRSGGCGQHFQFGSIYWSPATGAIRVTGAVLDRWAATGWEFGTLGYPTTEMFCGLRDGGCGQHFQGGSVYRSVSTPAVVVPAVLRDAWASYGWEYGPLGYPTGEAFDYRGALVQTFQGGTLARLADGRVVRLS